MPQMACLFFYIPYTRVTEKHQTRAADTPTTTVSLHHSLPYRHIHAFCMQFTLYHVKDNSP